MAVAIASRARAKVRAMPRGTRRAFSRRMRMITRMLLASVLAIGASSFAACDMADCPSTISGGDSCSAVGLSCSAGGGHCDCLNGHWACTDGDLPMVPPRDMTMRDLANPSD